MFLDPLIKAIRAPFDAVRGKARAVGNIKGGAKGDVQRLKGVIGEIKGSAQGGLDAAKGAAGQAKGAAGKAKSAAGQARETTSKVKNAGGSRQKGRRMGLFSAKPKCASCGKKLHPSWDKCPYCEAPVTAGGASASKSPTGKNRTMAMDVGAAGASSSGLAWLVPMEGGQVGELFPMRGRAVVGSAADCDIVLTDPSISSRHAEFAAGQGGFKVTDLGSTNGTFVNDERITSYELVDNDNVRLGRTNFRFKAL